MKLFNIIICVLTFATDIIAQRNNRRSSTSRTTLFDYDYFTFNRDDYDFDETTRTTVSTSKSTISEVEREDATIDSTNGIRITRQDTVETQRNRRTLRPSLAPIPSVENVNQKNGVEKPSPDKIKDQKSIPKWLLFGSDNRGKSSELKQDEDQHVEYEGYDGWYNNKAHPDLGAIDKPLIRILSSQYSDGVYKPSGVDRPNPIELSEAFLKGEIGERSATGKSAFFVYFGQQMVEEILDAQRSGCPPEYMNMKFPDKVYDTNGKKIPYRHPTNHTTMPLLRTRYDVRTGQSPNNPRQQLNEITPWIDGGLIYGTSKGWSDTLRAFNAGKLRSYSENNDFPAYNSINLPLANPPPPSGPYNWTDYDGKNAPRPKLLPVNRFFRIGNSRGNENPFLLTMGIIWFRWHNRIAAQLYESNPNWSDERIYNEARKWVIASYQNIVVNEWLPILLGETIGEYRGYDSSIDPQISHVFQSAAFRFGHTLVTSGGFKRTPDCSSINKIVRTCNNFWKPIEPLLNGGFEELIMGMSSQPSEREDNVVVEDIRGHVFGPMEFTRRDLMAINILRGRDHGLTDYLTARYELGLDNEVMKNKSIKEIANLLWSDTTRRDPSLIKKASEIYGNDIDKIDIWIGGILETTNYGPGQLFRHIILDQFRRIRNGDRFWFENERNNIFTKEQIERIKQLKIYDIIRSITTIKFGEIQPQLFRVPSVPSNPLSDTCLQKLTDEYECVTDIKNNVSETCKTLGSVTRAKVINDECTPPHTFDYFEGSELSYSLTFLGIGIFAIICVLILKFLVNRKLTAVEDLRKMKSKRKRMTLSDDVTLAQEWVGKDEGERPVLINCQKSRKCITVKLNNGRALRSIDLRKATSLQLIVITNTGQNYLWIKIMKEYDLILKFDTNDDRERFIGILESFLGSIGVGRERLEIDLKTMMKNAYTKAKRQKHLEQFFRVIFSHAFGGTVSTGNFQLNVKTVKEAISTELTQYEFAEALSLRSDSLFIQQMFALVDKDNNGYISFREFLDMMIIFAKGSAEQKAKLMFDMYDVEKRGKLSMDEFKIMIKSLLELANQSISTNEMDQVIASMFKSAGIKERQELAFNDFHKLLNDHKEELGYAELNFDVGTFHDIIPSEAIKRRSIIHRANDTVVRAYSYFGGVPPALGTDPIAPLITATAPSKTTIKPLPSLLRVETEKRILQPNWLLLWKRFIDEHKLEVFWISIYTFIIFMIFLERSFYYTYLREHSGLRQIAGLGVTITRGSASVMMFTFSTILLTMCRNIITSLRETFLHHYVPFDGAVSMHKYIAFWALIFSVIHSIGHAINFYHISTQTADDVTCLFRENYHATHELPKFHNWAWGTITGITGIFLLSLIILMYIFAIHYSRRHVFNAFWLTHNLYPVLYILMILHGLGRLISEPIFSNYFVIPIVIFTIDRLISVSRKKIEITVMKAVLHPSDVTMLQFKRPPGFEYKSGQWVRIACVALNGNEYHPFTLASAPHEDHLALFIRAVGPFTKNIRQTYDPENLKMHSYPKLYLDGPYGEGHQDWRRFEVSVLVGGGIGVTPFASILKDIAFRSNVNTKIMCKKVYFLWVTRTQKHFEWMVDVIKDAEEKDKNNLLTTHIFITQFYEKFDLRTTMLYICERHFQRVSNRSLFTGLKAKTHFGRPDFVVFLDSLQQEHSNVNRVGVFSCGPPPMTANVQRACESLNRKEGAIFMHHYENF